MTKTLVEEWFEAKDARRAKLRADAERAARVAIVREPRVETPEERRARVAREIEAENLAALRWM